MSKKTAVIAIGGNSLILPGQKGTVEEQFAAVKVTVDNVIKIINHGYNVVITHGNGPQIGNVLIQSETAKHLVPALPMDYTGAFTQGGVGYMIQQVANNKFYASNIKKDVATIITQVKVDPKDPAFLNPSKPVGPFFKSMNDVKEQIEKEGWSVKEDAGRGYRRVVPSPLPVEIVEKDVIKKLIKNDVVVIAVGGGGIPVILDGDDYKGIAAVIDKDFATSLLANEINADVFIISTGVEKVAINFNKPNQQFIDKMTVEQAKKYAQEGHFAKGSMLPKIEASIKFLENGGKQVIITCPEKLYEAVCEKAGTHIVKK